MPALGFGVELALFVGVDDKDVVIEFSLNCFSQSSFSCAWLACQHHGFRMFLGYVTIKVCIGQYLFAQDALVLQFAEAILLVTYLSISSCASR